MEDDTQEMNLLERSTGETLNPLPYLKYLKNKANQVYGVSFND